ncbi:uncharacterized protein [Physcomitrium patens]|uniref:Uncharacterized protein n=1 Tax=Physcomitrium patens TaxID=3218 RepID=A0A7I4E5P6_PHYPA
MERMAIVCILLTPQSGGVIRERLLLLSRWFQGWSGGAVAWVCFGCPQERWITLDVCLSWDNPYKCDVPKVSVVKKRLMSSCEISSLGFRSSK